MKRATRAWVRKAESDFQLAAAIARRNDPFHDEQCFHCQQSGEMALKALHYLAGARFVPGHSLVELLAPLVEKHPSLATLRAAAARLDQLYIPTRYPNGLPGGVPAEVFSEPQTREAIAEAARFVDQAGALV